MNGLRDYGTGQWEGGDPACDHMIAPNRASDKSTLNGGKGVGPTEKIKNDGVPYREVCGKCGARRIDAQIGLEDTPAAFVARLVEVYREVRRVLKPTGTCWVNLGDSYASGEIGRHDSVQGREIDGKPVTSKASNRQQSKLDTGLPPKNRMMIPARVAIALQEDGWWIRDEIIWHKPNPMPSSVTDRTTGAHEMVYMLTKAPRYWYDGDAIRESHAEATIERVKHGGRAYGHAGHQDGSGMVASGGWGSTAQQHNQERILDIRGRNKRSVWTVATEATPYSHFATFPSKLIEPMILAGCPATCCAVCGKPYVRVTERAERVQAHWLGTEQVKAKAAKGKHGATSVIETGSYQTYRTVGFAPSCDCRAGTVPGVVLDPFMGSGTTALVARRLGRSYIGCDLSAEYVALCNQRLGENWTPPLPGIDAPAAAPVALTQAALF